MRIAMAILAFSFNGLMKIVGVHGSEFAASSGFELRVNWVDFVVVSLDVRGVSGMGHPASRQPCRAVAH